MSSKHVYVPTTQGMLIAYRLEPPQDAKAETAKSATESEYAETPQSGEGHRQNIRFRQDSIPPLAFQTAGRTRAAARDARNRGGRVCRVVDRQGLPEHQLYQPARGKVAHIEASAGDRMRRLSPGRPICCPIPRWPDDPGIVFVVSGNGFVYAIEERTGEPLWKYSTGEAIVRPRPSSKIICTCPRCSAECIV